MGKPIYAASGALPPDPPPADPPIAPPQIVILPPEPPVYKELSASLSGASSVQGALQKSRPVAASLSGGSSVAASLKLGRRLDASVAGSSTVTAGLTKIPGWGLEKDFSSTGVIKGIEYHDGHLWVAVENLAGTQTDLYQRQNDGTYSSYASVAYLACTTRETLLSFGGELFLAIRGTGGAGSVGRIFVLSGGSLVEDYTNRSGVSCNPHLFHNGSYLFCASNPASNYVSRRTGAGTWTDGVCADDETAYSALGFPFQGGVLCYNHYLDGTTTLTRHSYGGGSYPNSHFSQVGFFNSKAWHGHASNTLQYLSTLSGSWTATASLGASLTLNRCVGGTGRLWVAGTNASAQNTIWTYDGSTLTVHKAGITGSINWLKPDDTDTLCFAWTDVNTIWSGG